MIKFTEAKSTNCTPPNSSITMKQQIWPQIILEQTQTSKEKRSTVSQEGMCSYLQHQSEKSRRNKTQSGASKGKWQSERLSCRVEQFKVHYILFLSQSCTGPDPYWSGKGMNKKQHVGMHEDSKRIYQWYISEISWVSPWTEEHLKKNMRCASYALLYPFWPPQCCIDFNRQKDQLYLSIT